MIGEITHGVVHENGWKSVAVVSEETGNGRWGDYALGTGYVALYRKPDSDWVAEISYYVEPVDVDEDDPRHGTFGIQCETQIWRDVIEGDQEDLEISHDYGDSICYQSLEEAEAVARRLAQQDEAYVFCV